MVLRDYNTSKNESMVMNVVLSNKDIEQCFFQNFNQELVDLYMRWWQRGKLYNTNRTVFVFPLGASGHDMYKFFAEDDKNKRKTILYDNTVIKMLWRWIHPASYYKMMNFAWDSKTPTTSPSKLQQPSVSEDAVLPPAYHTEPQESPVKEEVVLTSNTHNATGTGKAVLITQPTNTQMEESQEPEATMEEGEMEELEEGEIEAAYDVEGQIEVVDLTMDDDNYNPPEKDYHYERPEDAALGGTWDFNIFQNHRIIAIPILQSNHYVASYYANANVEFHDEATGRPRPFLALADSLRREETLIDAWDEYSCWLLSVCHEIYQWIEDEGITEDADITEFKCPPSALLYDVREQVLSHTSYVHMEKIKSYTNVHNMFTRTTIFVAESFVASICRLC